MKIKLINQIKELFTSIREHLAFQKIIRVMLQDLQMNDLSYEKASWNDLSNALEKAGFEEDEYIAFSNKYEDCREKLIWDQETRWVYAYWVNGSSEGYYVHIGKTLADELTTNDGITAKFWSKIRVEQCSIFSQQFINAL